MNLISIIYTNISKIIGILNEPIIKSDQIKKKIKKNNIIRLKLFQKLVKFI